MTNREKLSRMTNEELAEIIELRDCFLVGCQRCPGFNDPDCDCEAYFVKWLESEVKDDKS